MLRHLALLLFLAACSPTFNTPRQIIWHVGAAHWAGDRLVVTRPVFGTPAPGIPCRITVPSPPQNDDELDAWAKVMRHEYGYC